MDFFVFFWPIFGSRWPLFGPPWPSPCLPGLRFNSLDPRESGLDPVSANFRPFFFFATSEKSYLGVLPPKIDSYGLGTIIERSASKFCISGLRRRVKRSSWSNFMAMSIRFILQWRSRLNTCFVSNFGVKWSMFDVFSIVWSSDSSAFWQEFKAKRHVMTTPKFLKVFI